jgi:hypothetical protein
MIWFGRLEIIPLRVQTVLALLAAAGLLVTAGCGASAYGKKYNDRLAQLEISSKFNVLRDPTTKLMINLRPPQIFGKAFSALSADPNDGTKRISWTEFAPTFLPDFPGLKRTFEGEDINGNRSKFYLYVGEATLASVHGKFPYDLWRNRIRKFYPAAGWQVVNAQTPTGGSVPWKSLNAKFDIKPSDSNNPDEKPHSQVFQMWVYEGPKSFLVLGWTAPADTWNSLEIGKLAVLTAGSIEVESTPASAPALAPAK